MAILALLLASRPFGSRKAYLRAMLAIELYTAIVITAAVLWCWVKP